jgi:hypothetical protein
MTRQTTAHQAGSTPGIRLPLGLLAALAACFALALPAAAPAAQFGDASGLPVACDYGEPGCSIDLDTETCSIPGGTSDQPRANFWIRGDKVVAINLPWGSPGFDSFVNPIFENWRRNYYAAVSGDWQSLFGRCDRKLVVSTGRALGIIAWMTRAELDQSYPYVGYAGLPAEDRPAEDSVNEGDPTPPEVLPETTGEGEATAAIQAARESVRPATEARARRSAAARPGKATSKPAKAKQRPSLKKRAR